MDSAIDGPDQFVFLYLIFFFLLILGSAIFSATETALFSLSRLRLKQLEDQDDPVSKRIVALISYPSRLLVSIILGNLLVNTTASTVAAGLAQSIGGDSAVSISAGIVVLILLVFGEITPKVIAVSNPDKYSALLATPITILSTILKPVTAIIEGITNRIIHALGAKPLADLPNLTEDELKTVLNTGVELGIIEGDRGDMLSSALEFADTRVKEIMTPRPDVMFLKGDDLLEDAFENIKSTGFSRMPVCDKSPDSIMGIFYVKDILPYKISGNMKVAIKDILRPAYFVPETKTIDQLMRTFQKKKIQMAIVVDEYGGTEGIVTMEDILEQIVGDIQDEYDVEEPMIIEIDGGLLVDASISIYDLAEELGFEVDDGVEYDTLGGMLLAHFDRIPETGEEICAKNFSFKIKTMESNRIVSVFMKKVEKDNGAGATFGKNGEMRGER